MGHLNPVRPLISNPAEGGWSRGSMVSNRYQPLWTSSSPRGGGACPLQLVAHPPTPTPTQFRRKHAFTCGTGMRHGIIRLFPQYFHWLLPETQSCPPPIFEGRAPISFQVESPLNLVWLTKEGCRVYARNVPRRVLRQTGSLGLKLRDPISIVPARSRREAWRSGGRGRGTSRGQGGPQGKKNRLSTKPLGNMDGRTVILRQKWVHVGNKVFLGIPGPSPIH